MKVNKIYRVKVYKGRLFRGETPKIDEIYEVKKY